MVMESPRRSIDHVHSDDFYWRSVSFHLL